MCLCVFCYSIISLIIDNISITVFFSELYFNLASTPLHFILFFPLIKYKCQTLSNLNFNFTTLLQKLCKQKQMIGNRKKMNKETKKVQIKDFTI